MDAGLERVKVICSWEDGHGKRVPVSRSHRIYPVRTDFRTMRIAPPNGYILTEEPSRTDINDLK